MTRKLKINNKFTPCPIDDGDELYPNGIFVFNITKMTNYIWDNHIPCEEVLVRDFSRGSSKFKEDHLATVDVTKLSSAMVIFQFERSCRQPNFPPLSPS